MTSLSWKIREWMLAPVIKLQEEEMAADKDAAAQLDKLQEETEKAIEALEAHISADEETDAALLRPKLQRQAALNKRLTDLLGVSPTGTDTATPTDVRTGQPVEAEQTVVSGPVVENSPQNVDPAGQGQVSGDNSTGTSNS